MGSFSTSSAIPALTRFWSKVDMAGPDDCWSWTGARTSRRPTRPGYGEIMVAAKIIYAHRFAYVLAFGAIPPGALVMHICDNGLCVNPAHLRLGTAKDNSRDMIAKGRGRGQFPKGMYRGPGADA